MKKFFIIALLAYAFTSCSDKFAFRNPNLPVEKRVEDLLKRLTLEEKVGQMMNSTPAIERLGIPPYDWWNEALHGVARAELATVFPQAIAMAATFDDEALLKTFTMVSDEARAKYHRYSANKDYSRYKGLTFWTPNINIFRDPRWGRGMETYGEDPYLTGRMGVAVVKGLQGDDPKYFKSHACAKHYAVHSGPEWNRHEFDAKVSPRDLWTTYLPAFEDLVVEGNVQEVMCAYNRFEGKPCCGSDKLLTDILRNKWGYKAIILTDCGAIDDFWAKGRHETHSDAASASADAVRNGTDLECGGSYKSLLKAVQDGLVKESELDVSLRRLLRGRFELGMFDPDSRVKYSQIPYSVVSSREHVAQALEMARKSIVLLQNKNNILPLSKDIKKIAVVGPNSADSTMLWANYNGFPSKTVTILQGIKNKLPNTEVVYEQGCNHTDDFVYVNLNSCVYASNQQGYDIEFFKNKELEGEPVYKGHTPNIDYESGGGTQFAENVPAKHFSARINCEFIAPSSGEMVLTGQFDDGHRIYLDDVIVSDYWKETSTVTANHVFKAERGRKYRIKVEYFQGEGDANLHFSVGKREEIQGSSVVAKVRDADVIIFAGGISPRLEGEEMSVKIDGFKNGDRTDVEIPAIQRKLVQALKNTGKPVIYVLCTGSAIALNWENENLDAVINAWYGGQEAGTAVADVLFGDYNPAGRLPVTFYKSADQLPDFLDYGMKGRTYRYMTEEPLYPFGYGLSYTTFEYKNAQLLKSKISKNEPATLVFDIVNTGTLDGDEVAQVYISNPNDPEAPIKALKAFKRVNVKAGTGKQVSIDLPSKSFYSFNDKTQSMEIRPGKYGILYGGSSSDKDLQSIELTIE
ncbi:MAG: glycoside hydrolase family 3 C-terminal domain-containing protein [Prevotellaceae bacterium]|jgi:beta-glucosidase|nr:glycoside hydrolase family 3 C-terminal domain-containing protein [Prevotellaceae bacterium]